MDIKLNNNNKSRSNFNNMSHSKLLDGEENVKYMEIQYMQHSPLLMHQIEEMMSTLEIKCETKRNIQKLFDAISKSLMKQEKSEEFQLSDLKWLKEHELNLPVKELLQLPKIDGTFTFVPPAKVLMVGSYASDLSSKHSKVIDIALVLPKKYMQNTKLYNGEWILRRALYLTWIGKLLQEDSELVASVSWTLHCGSRLRPILQVTPAKYLKKTWKINLFPLPHDDQFKIHIISPMISNVSLSWYYNRKEFEGESLPSPYHNWACCVDLVALKHLSLIKENINDNLIQGLTLLKIWMKQRNLTLGEGSFSSHLMTLFVVYLTKFPKKNPKLSARMSPYQVFRITLLHIAETDWTVKGPSLFDESTVTDRNLVVPNLEDFHRLYPIVFVDNTGFFNIAGNVSKESYIQLKHEANIGLKILALSSVNFESLFINRTEFLLNSDQMVKISLSADVIKNICSKIEKKSPNFKADHLGDVSNAALSYIVSVLRQGLEDRVSIIYVSREDVNCEFGSSFSTGGQNLILGFCIKKFTSLTKGPAADTKEAKSFEAFWGDLSELRRFHDNINHVVLWADGEVPLGNRRLILGEVVRCIMNQHFGVPSNKIQVIACQLEDVLRPRVSLNQENFKYGTGEELISSAIISFDTLNKKLRSLPLPLQITSFQSTSDVLKHAIVFPPLPSRVPKPIVENPKRLKVSKYQAVSAENMRSPFYRPSINVQIFLEISGKWPDDLLAIKAIKQEFLQNISELLEKDGITCVLIRNGALVVWDGYVFSIEICYRREIYLLKNVDENSVRHDTDASFTLEKQIEILPKLTSCLNSMQSEYSCYGASVRLVRRWTSSQLLIPHFPHTVIDLLVAYLFINPYPYSTPNTPHVALLRFMKLMSTTDWNSTPLFLNLRNQLTKNDESELTKRFTDRRSLYPLLFICTPCELRPLQSETEPTPEDWNKRLKYASCWTRGSPSLLILNRIKIVTQTALTAIEGSLWRKNFDFKILFRPQLSDYNVLIYLNENQIARRLENIDNKEEMRFELYSHTKGELLPVTNFDVVQLYLNELKESFSNDALFFYDEHGGNVIGVLWKPRVFEEKELKKSNLERSKVVGTNKLRLVTDVDAILEEFRIVGSGLVKDIKLKE